MNTEDKNLLVVYLLGRVSYNVVVNVNGIKWYDRILLSLTRQKSKGGFAAVITCEKEKDENFCEDCPYRNVYHLNCVLNWIRDRMPKPTWDSVEKLKERGLAFDAPNN